VTKGRTAALALVVTIVLALIVNFDGLLLHLATDLPGDLVDAALALTHVWWPVYSMGQPDALSIHSFFTPPYLINHLLYMPVLQSPVFALLSALGGPVPGLNLLLVASQIATHALTYVFLRGKGAPITLALAGAAAFVLAPWYGDAVGSADVIGASFWVIPAALIAWDRWAAQPSTWRAALVVVALYAAVLAGVQHVIGLILLWLPFAIGTLRPLWQRGGEADQRALAARQHVPAMGLALIALLYVYPMPNITRTLQGFEPAYNALPLPPADRSIIGAILHNGPLIAGLAVVTAFFAPGEGRRGMWLVVGGVALLMGMALLPDPVYMLLAGLGMRVYPLAERGYLFGVGLFALMVYAALGWRETWGDALARPAYGWGAAAALIALALGTNPATIRAMPRHTVDVPDFYAAIAAEPESYVLVDLPFGLVSTLDGAALGEGADLAQYAVWHHKRPLGAPAPYYEPRVFDDLSGQAFLFPGALDGADSGEAARALAEAVDEWRIGYVVLHPDRMAEDAAEAFDALAEESGALCPAVEGDGLIVYRAQWHPAGCEDGL
jgi:hypothetical protein